MKVALVCDWLTNVGGAEKVLLKLHHLYPQAPIYTSKYSRKGISWFDDADVRTGWLQIFPAGMRRFLGVFRERWFRKLDLTEYDLVISVTGAEAKAVQRLKPGAKHISYCHVPTQYYWQMYDEYVENPGFGVLNPLVRVCFKALVKPLRRRDFEAAQRVDQFVTISEYARGLIAKYYKRDAIIVHPPVELDAFSNGRKPSPYAYYIVTSRQVTWKRLDLAVKETTKILPSLVSSISSSLTQERPMGFGLKGERVAKTPILLFPPRRGGRTVGFHLSLSTSEKSHKSHRCEKPSIPFSTDGSLYSSVKIIRAFNSFTRPLCLGIPNFSGKSV